MGETYSQPHPFHCNQKLMNEYRILISVEYDYFAFVQANSEEEVWSIAEEKAEKYNNNSIEIDEDDFFSFEDMSRMHINKVHEVIYAKPPLREWEIVKAETGDLKLRKIKNKEEN
jgi:hypothetical protein